MLGNTHQPFTHPRQVSRLEACCNWVAIAGSWCCLKGSFFSTSNAMRRPGDSSDSLERTTSGPLSGPVTTAVHLRPWVAAAVSRRAFLQSQVPLLTKQCVDGSCYKICTTDLAKGCHLFLQHLGHSASTSRVPIRLWKCDGRCRVVLEQIIRHVAQRRNILRGHGPLPASTFLETPKHRCSNPEFAGICISGGKPLAYGLLASQPKAIRRRILSFPIYISQNHDYC